MLRHKYPLQNKEQSCQLTTHNAPILCILTTLIILIFNISNSHAVLAEKTAPIVSQPDSSFVHKALENGVEVLYLLFPFLPPLSTAEQKLDAVTKLSYLAGCSGVYCPRYLPYSTHLIGPCFALAAASFSTSDVLSKEPDKPAEDLAQMLVSGIAPACALTALVPEHVQHIGHASGFFCGLIAPYITASLTTNNKLQEKEKND